MIEDFLPSIEAALPILIILFLFVLSSIILIRAFFGLMLHFASKKYAKSIIDKKTRKEQKMPKKFDKEDSELFRKKEAMKVEKITSKEDLLQQEEDRRALAEVKIIDVVKPVGPFTAMILGQKLTYLVSSAKLMNQNSNKGFWVSMVEAQGRAAGRQKGRMR